MVIVEGGPEANQPPKFSSVLGLMAVLPGAASNRNLGNPALERCTVRVVRRVSCSRIKDTGLNKSNVPTYLGSYQLCERRCGHGENGAAACSFLMAMLSLPYLSFISFFSLTCTMKGLLVGHLERMNGAGPGAQIEGTTQVSW